MVKNYMVSLAPEQAAKEVIEYLVNRKRGLLASIHPCSLVDDYRLESPTGKVISLIFTRYYARIRGYVTLVITISDLNGCTNIHISSGGHIYWDHSDDWGASADFIKLVEAALQEHIS